MLNGNNGGFVCNIVKGRKIEQMGGKIQTAKKSRLITFQAEFRPFTMFSQLCLAGGSNFTTFSYQLRVSVESL
jgi:hypothetical protein